MTLIHSSASEGRDNPPLRRLELAALVIPSVLLTLLIALDYVVLEPLLPSEDAHLVMLVVGLAGVIAFSVTMFARLTELHARLARLLAQVQQIAALEERNRIGIDLHDGAIQSLYGVSLVIEDAADRVAAEPYAARQALTKAVDRLNATIADLRAYVLGLKPVSMEGTSLRESLQGLAASARSSALVAVTVDVDGSVDALEPKLAENVFYIAAGAIANVVRHARARRAAVGVRRDGEHVVLTVGDDGVGFDAATTREGNGLRGIAERVRGIGGALAIESAPGEGTRVRVEIPAATLGR